MEKTKTILSIDDSKAVHAFLDRSLEGSSFKLIHALSAKEGISILNEKKSEISLILLDWEMPIQNGPEALVEIRKSFQSIPVVMLTSKNNPEDIMQMLSSGANEYIMKPFTPDILLFKLEALLTEE